MLFIINAKCFIFCSTSRHPSFLSAKAFLKTKAECVLTDSTQELQGVCGYTKTESWAGQDPGPQQIGERWKRPGLGYSPSGFCLLSWGNKGKPQFCLARLSYLTVPSGGGQGSQPMPGWQGERTSAPGKQRSGRRGEGRAAGPGSEAGGDGGKRRGTLISVAQNS